MLNGEGKARLLFVLWHGDYRQTYRALSAGGDETYYAQRYSIESVAGLGDRFGAAGQLTIISDEPYDEVLPNGVRAMGAGGDGSRDLESAIACIERFEPTHVVLTTPQQSIVKWCFDRGVEVLPLLADSFQLPAAGRASVRGGIRRIRHQLQVRRLVEMLNDSRVPWVGNHNRPASRQLVELGVHAEKVVPWDWPAMVRPGDYAAKRYGADPSRPWRILYMGLVTEEKGVGDSLRAVARLHDAGRRVALTVIGDGDVGRFTRLAASLGITGCCEFASRQPHHWVVRLLRDADLALVPSRHDYPEGLPMTIYEALAVRTPLIISDHPMFESLRDWPDAAVITPAEDDARLAIAIESVMSDPDRYEQLSREGHRAWQAIQCPVKYGRFVHHFVRDEDDDRAALAAHSIAAGGGEVAAQQLSVSA